MRNKFKIWDLIWFANILIILYFLLPFIFFLINEDLFDTLLELFFMSIIGKTIYYSLTIPVFFLWLSCLKIAYKKQQIEHFITLIIFNGLYTPIYYIIIARKYLT